jgi:hypothetical protein
MIRIVYSGYFLPQDTYTLKPIDIVVLSELVLRGPENTFSQAQLAQKLQMSQPSIGRSLAQLHRSGLWRDRVPQSWAFHKLIIHAIGYVFPGELGAPTRGLPTAHVGAGLSDRLSSEQLYVWPLEEADSYGPALHPIHPVVPKVAQGDPAFHELMALIDVFRVGRARERLAAGTRLVEILGLGS